MIQNPAKPLSESGPPRLSVGIFSFSHMPLEDAVKEIALLNVPTADVGVFPTRHHVKIPEIMADPAAAAGRLRRVFDKYGLKAGDIFFHPGPSPTEIAINHPDPAHSAEAGRRFKATLSFAVSLGAAHVTTSPGMPFPSQTPERDAERAAGPLRDWLALAGNAGLGFGVEPHVGSVMDSTGKALAMLDRVPGLKLTLDPSHFIFNGCSLASIVPLYPFTTQTHLRPACRGKMQCRLEESDFDLAGFVYALPKNVTIRHTLEILSGQTPDCDAVDIPNTIRKITSAIMENRV